MKLRILIFFFCIPMAFVFGQKKKDSKLDSPISIEMDDTQKVDSLSDFQGFLSNPELVFKRAQQGLKLAQEIGYQKGEIDCQLALALSGWAFGDYSTSIKLGHIVRDYAVANNDSILYNYANAAITNSYRDQGDYMEALKLLFTWLRDLEANHECYGCAVTNGSIGSNYFGLKNYDSALFYLKKSLNYPDDYGARDWVFLMLGRTMVKLNNDSAAFSYYRQSIRSLSHTGNVKDLAGAYTSLARLYTNLAQTDSAVLYAQKAIDIADQMKFNKELADAYIVLSNAYEAINISDALNFYKLAIAAKDSLYSQEQQRNITSFRFNEELRQNEKRNAELQYRNRNRTIILTGLLAFAFVFVIVLIRNNHQKQKANQQIEKAYKELKSTQTQLIHSEKMASLGELTAGIAHEIQNPLNFVNNFSEVNTELVEEQKEEIKKGNLKEIEELANDIIENEKKIMHHGKRAEEIVKSMLQHSRGSEGIKELTDINALADEYLRLAYHGFRAKDKSFNADFKTDLDSTIPKIEVVPQDIGRVLLNLINNAFYACTERSRSAVSQKAKAESKGYKPTVTVSTHLMSPLEASGGGKGEVIISVADNGPGIPEDIKDKIFQPFFTTKATGEGTGLGLSLSYDIITKGHGGSIEVESEEGKGTEFIIRL